jgi:cytochrome c oxidase subunit III
MVATFRNSEIEGTARYGHYRLGVLVGLASIVMLFTSLTSAYIVRAAVTNDWRPLPAPKAIWVSTAIILISSVAIEMARRAVRRQASRAYGFWLAITGVLGLGFLVSQFLAWRQLARQGIYIATNPYSSFFYLLTGVHGVHLAGGLLALGFLLVGHRARWQSVSGAKQVAVADSVSLYWHFMDALWIYLFLLLFVWR